MTRIIRKIKQLNAKKGTPIQLEKNKRKAESLKKETEIIKVIKAFYVFFGFFFNFLEA